MCSCHQYYFCQLPLENDIDGEALSLLVKDIEEFSSIVPKALGRLKIKNALENYKEASKVSN